MTRGTVQSDFAKPQWFPDAARELQTHVEKMSGVQLSVKAAGKASGTPVVRVGPALAPKLEAVIREKSSDPAAFAIDVKPGAICLAGLSPEGTLFAASLG